MSNIPRKLFVNLNYADRGGKTRTGKLEMWRQFVKFVCMISASQMTNAVNHFSQNSWFDRQLFTLKKRWEMKSNRFLVTKKHLSIIDVYVDALHQQYWSFKGLVSWAGTTPLNTKTLDEIAVLRYPFLQTLKLSCCTWLMYYGGG